MSVCLHLCTTDQYWNKSSCCDWLSPVCGQVCVVRNYQYLCETCSTWSDSEWVQQCWDDTSTWSSAQRGSQCGGRTLDLWCWPWTDCLHWVRFIMYIFSVCDGSIKCNILVIMAAVFSIILQSIVYNNGRRLRCNDCCAFLKYFAFLWNAPTCSFKHRSTFLSDLICWPILKLPQFELDIVFQSLSIIRLHMTYFFIGICIWSDGLLMGICEPDQLLICVSELESEFFFCGYNS